MAKFVSRRGEFRLIIRPGDHFIDEARRSVNLPGERVEFHNHIFTTKDEGLIEYLKNHGLFKKEYDIAESDVGTKTQNRQMITGASSAADSLNPSHKKFAIKRDRTREPSSIEQSEPINEQSDPSISREEIAGMIDTKLDDFFSQMKTLMQGQTKVREETSNIVEKVEYSKPKKVFKCPIPGCDQTFDSGFAVGFHKKEAHK